MKRNWKTAATVVGLGVLGSSTLATALALFIAQTIARPPRQDPQNIYMFTPWELGATFENVTFQAPGGPRLAGWWLDRPEAKEVIVAMSGHKGKRSDVLGISTQLWRAGYNVLMFDFRGLGESEIRTVTLGHEEVSDMMTALDYVKQRIPAAKIGVLGFSMGAAVAVMGSARRKDIAAVVADSPFARQRDVVEFNVRNVSHLPVWPIVPLAEWLIMRRHGWKLREVRPIDQIALISPTPLLLIHGGADRIVNPDDAQELFAAAGNPKELWFLPGVGHCGAYFVDRDVYLGRVRSFFDRYLRDKQNVRPALTEQVNVLANSFKQS